MEIINNRALVLRTKMHETILAQIPKSKYLREVEDDVHEVAVYFGPEEVAALKEIGFKMVPSAPLRSYTYPGIFTPMAHQRETAEFLVSHKKAFVFSDMGCVDADTEYLSPTGWVKINAYTGGEVAQYHPETGEAEFVNPKEYVKLPCTDMIRIKTKYGIDQLLSPEHRVLLSSGARTEVLQASELLDRHDTYIAGVNPGRIQDKISYSKAGIPAAFTMQNRTAMDLTEAQIRIQVAIIADGYFRNSTNRCIVRLKKERKILRLRELLTAGGITWSERISNDYMVFKFLAPQRLKHFDTSWWAASEAQKLIIASEVMHWDGHTPANSNRACRYSSYIKESADFIQYIFSSLGYIARLTINSRERRETTEIEYVVTTRNGKKRDLQLLSQSSIGVRHKTMSLAPSTDGFKYCFMVPSTFLIFRRNGCVFASGNTGKSASAAWAADYLMSKGKAARVLIVCPVSIMQAAWQNDLFKTLMHRSVGIAYGTRSQRLQVIKGDYEIVIINYDGLATVNDELKAAGFDIIIADEANYLKNTSTNRWKAFNHLVTPEATLWLMTGTPAAQSPEDAYGLAKLVCPERVPKFLGAWRDMVMQKVTMFKWVPRPKAKETVFNALQPAIRFTKEECLDLPEIVYVERVVHMSAQQAKYYAIMKRDLTMQAAGEEITALNAAAAMNKILQIATGCVYSVDGEVVRFDCKDRLNVVEEVIEASDKRVIIFAPFTHTIRLIEDHLSKCGYRTATINGEVPMNKRSKIISEFQDMKNPNAPHVIIIQPQAAAHGITLTAASTVIWFAPTYSVDTWLQANARAHRKGQDTKVTVVKLSGSPVEKKMYDMLEGKLATHISLIELYKDVISS